MFIYTIGDIIGLLILAPFLLVVLLWLILCGILKLKDVF